MMSSTITAIADHLWQSTVFAAAAGLLTLALRRNRARVRHGLWMAASFKFLIPISMLIAWGSHLEWRKAPVIAPRNVSVLMEEVSQPFSVPSISWPLLASVPPGGRSPLPAILLGIWACGFVGIACAWWIPWRRIRSAVLGATPVRLGVSIEARCSPTLMEPGVFGIFRPVLMLPEGIAERLTPAQLEAVIAHELCHVRHRDNLAAAIHMFVETVFWFHPLVWWIGKRMVEERERGCDEEVLAGMGEPRTYAEGILNICKLYVESPLECVSGVTGGANLKKRIEAIMSNRAVLKMTVGKKLLLGVAAAFAAGSPLIVGLVRGQPPAPLAFEVASVKPGDSNAIGSRLQFLPGGRFSAMSWVKPLIQEAYGVRDYQVSGGPGWLNSDRFVIEAKAESPAASEDQLRRMLQSLLAERFQLKLHREMKEFPVYALVIGKGGSKIQPLKEGDGGKCGIGFNKDGLFACKQTMARVAQALGSQLHRPVLDQTGLQGQFDLKVDYDQYSLENVTPPADYNKPSLFTAIQEQLGLRLDPQKAPMTVLVIDSVMRPSGN